jgi:hypothetical protein
MNQFKLSKSYKMIGKYKMRTSCRRFKLAYIVALRSALINHMFTFFSSDNIYIQ